MNIGAFIYYLIVFAYAALVTFVLMLGDFNIGVWLAFACLFHSHIQNQKIK